MPLDTTRRAAAVILILACAACAGAAPGSSRSLPDKAGPGPTPSPTPQEVAPVAQISDIVVGGGKVIRAEVAQAKVIRAAGGAEEAAQLNQNLFVGDNVETGEGTQLTIVFADPVKPLEQFTEVILSPKTRVSVGSIWNIFGSILNRVRGYFRSGGGPVTGGTGSTEFVISVEGDEAHLTVLEGVVDTLVFDVAVGGESLPGRTTFSVKPNDKCRRPHSYEFGRPETMPWLELTPQAATLGPGQSVEVMPAVKLKKDEAAPAKDAYSGEVIVTCLDCNKERGCGLSPESGEGAGDAVTTARVPIKVTIRSQAVPVEKKFEVSGTRGAAGEARLTKLDDEALEKEVKETSELILAASATDQAPNVLPNFNSVEERNEAFREARMKAVLGDDDLSSLETLGDVYLDWGNSVRAVQAYEKVEQAYKNEKSEGDKTDGRAHEVKDSAEAKFRANYSEALRLSGNLDGAETQVNLALSRDNTSVRALNAQGNRLLDRGRRILNPKPAPRTRASAHGSPRARTAAMMLLNAAEEKYEKALALALQQPDISPQQRAVLLTNLGDFYSTRRDLDYEDKTSPGEISEWNQKALEAYTRAADLDPKNLYALSGRAFTNLAQANIARLRGDPTADETYATAQAQFEQLRGIDPTYQPAYTGLGIVYANLYDKTRAQEQFQLAALLNPEVGREPVSMPDVKDKPRQVAIKLITDAGLVPVTDGDGEFVTDQKVEPGTTLRLGQKVVLKLNSGDDDRVFYIKNAPRTKRAR
ncbi:MAG TPA: PASTA domain-containing protein [Pyrinomonadaceae bacterium]|nr:PASTA domain-containing protein [Pyrinomonadaceae bacterium]